MSIIQVPRYRYLTDSGRVSGFVLRSFETFSGAPFLSRHDGYRVVQSISSIYRVSPSWIICSQGPRCLSAYLCLRLLHLVVDVPTDSNSCSKTWWYSKTLDIMKSSVAILALVAHSAVAAPFANGSWSGWKNVRYLFVL